MLKHPSLCLKEKGKSQSPHSQAPLPFQVFLNLFYKSVHVGAFLYIPVLWISGALEVWRALCLYFGSVQGPTLLQNPHSASNASVCFLGEEEEDLAQRDREGWAEGGRGREGERPNQKYHFRITSITCPDSDHTHYTDSKESARSHTTKSWDWNSGLSECKFCVCVCVCVCVCTVPRKSPRLFTLVYK